MDWKKERAGASIDTAPADGRARLAAAHERFAAACRDLAARGAPPMRTTMFGAVPVEDFVRFMEIHTRHHGRQIGAGQRR